MLFYDRSYTKELKNFTLPRNRTVTENLKFESGEIQGYVWICVRQRRDG